MSWKKWNLCLVIFIIFFILSIVSANFVVDPFYVFHSKLLKREYYVNERFSKIEFLKKNPSKFNSYLLGSSRIGTTDPDTIEKYIPGSSFYNLTLASATLYDNFVHLKYFFDNGYNIKNVYLQIDITENLTNYELSDTDYLHRYHPYITGMSLGSYYLSYLMNVSYANIAKKIKFNLMGKDYIKYDIEGSGRFFLEDQEKRISENPEEYIKNEPTFNNKVSRNIRGVKAKDNIIALGHIKQLCDSKGVKLIMFVTPHHHKMVDQIVYEDYLAFLKEISDISEFWNFSGYNSITNNDKNYYEYSHYRPYIGDLIAARIFNDRTVEVPADFGVLVNKNNILKHINELSGQIKKSKTPDTY